MVKKSVVAALVTVFALGAASVPAIAGDGIQAGAFDVFPIVTFTESYKSNVFSASGNEALVFSEEEVDDFVTSLKGELMFELPMEDFKLSFGGWADWMKYADLDSQDRTDWGLKGSLGAAFPGGLGFRVGGLHQVSWLEASESEGSGEEYIQDVIDGELSFEIGDRFRVEGMAANTQYDYDESLGRDRVEGKVGATCFWKFAPKTSALVGVSYTDFAYDNDIRGTTTNQDNTALRVTGGLSWKVTGKSTGRAEAGYEKKDYSDLDSDNEYFIMKLGTTHTLSRATTLNANASRASTETDFSGNPYYITTVVGADIKQQFTGKTYGKGLLSWQNDEYPEDAIDETGAMSGRDEDILTAGLAVGWDATRWLNVELRYTFAEKDSNFNEYDYTNHIYAVAVKGEF